MIRTDVLSAGSHKTPEEGLCALELAAYLAGEPHSDCPKCACPVLSAAVRILNDATWSGDETRTVALMPLAHALVGSRAPTREHERLEALLHLAQRVWLPRALYVAVIACDAVRIDTSAMRAAAIACLDGEKGGAEEAEKATEDAVWMAKVVSPTKATRATRVAVTGAAGAATAAVDAAGMAKSMPGMAAVNAARVAWAAGVVAETREATDLMLGLAAEETLAVLAAHSSTLATRQRAG